MPYEKLLDSLGGGTTTLLNNRLAIPLQCAYAVIDSLTSSRLFSDSPDDVEWTD